MLSGLWAIQGGLQASLGSSYRVHVLVSQYRSQSERDGVASWNVLERSGGATLRLGAWEPDIPGRRWICYFFRF